MIHPELLTRLIKYNFSPTEITAALLLSQKNTVNWKHAENYVKNNPVINTKLKDLQHHKIISVFEGQPITLENSTFLPEYSISKSYSFEMAEELWDKYPAAFPLGDGAMFIARKGPDKHEVLKLYLERIGFDSEKHQFVMKQLDTYTKMVFDRKINGHRIHDWISNEMWDIVTSLESASRGEFKTDI